MLSGAAKILLAVHYIIVWYNEANIVPRSMLETIGQLISNIDYLKSHIICVCGIYLITK